MATAENTGVTAADAVPVAQPNMNQPSLRGVFPGQNNFEEEPAAAPVPTVGQRRAAEAAAAKAAAEAAGQQPRTNAPNAANLPKPPFGQTRHRRQYGKERAAAAALEAAKRAAEPEAAANFEPIENNTGNGNANSINTQEREIYNVEEQAQEQEQEQDEPGPILATAHGDPSLPHILKLGQGSFAEYITLKQIPIGSAGEFNALQTGSKEAELSRKYGIDTDDGIAAMQRAFGVRNQHQTPPIFGYIEKGCLPKGFDRVRTALEMRLETLSVNIDAVQGSMAANPMRRRQQWIEDILEKTQELSESCQEPTASVSSLPKPVATSGCPCLDELGLLRNLTYIISFLTGTTDPQVKQQLEQITLHRMLNAAQKGNTNQASQVLKDIISVLEAYVQNPVQKNIPVNDDRIQSILKPIYTAVIKLHDKTKLNSILPTEVTIDMIMSELNKVIEILEESQKKTIACEGLENRIHDLEEELAAEKAKGVRATESQQQVTGLQEELKALTTTLEGLRTQLAQSQGDVSSARDALRACTEEMAAEVKRLTDSLTEKESRIHSLESDLEDEEGHKTSLKEIITRLTAEKARLEDAHTAALAEVQGQINAKETEVQTLREQLTAETAESAEKTGQQEVITGHLQTLTESITQCEENLKRLREEKGVLEIANRDLTDHLAETRAALAASQTERGRDEERIHDLEGQLDDLRQQLDAKSAEKAAADSELEGLRSRIEANKVEIDGLKEQITQLSAEKEQVVADLEAEKKKCADADAAKVEYEKEKAELERHLGEQRSLEGSLRAELATATADGQSSKSDKEALEKELASALAKIASLEAALEQVTSKSAASQSKMDEAHKAELAALQSELDQTKAEVERIKGVAAQERESLIRAQEEGIAGKKAEIESIEKQLAAAVQTAADKGQLEAEMTRVTAELEAAKGALADLRAELAERPTKANLDQRNVALARKDAEILEKEEKIRELLKKVTELKGDFDSLSAEKDTLLSGLAAAQDAAESMISAEEGAEKDAEIEKLKEALAHASSVVDAQGAALAEAQGARGATKERLNTLLGHLLINPELRDQAHAFLNGDDAAIEPMQRDLCDMYGYLANIINLQLRKIDSSGLPKEAKEDIFNVFKNISDYDPRRLLAELNGVFQELFVQVAQTSTIPEELLLKKEYPELAKTLGSYTLESGQPLKMVGPSLNTFIVELGTFGYMSAVYVEPRPGNFFVLKKKLHTTPFDFANKNTSHMTPLVILGIKMIQLMAALLKDKYSDLARRCGTPIAGIEVRSREVTPVLNTASVVSDDPVALAKRDFDNSVSQLTSNLLMQHIMRYTSILNDPKAMLGAEKLKHFPKHIAYAVLLSMYSHHLTETNPRLQLRASIQGRTDVLDAVIRKLEKDETHPEYADLIRRARE